MLEGSLETFPLRSVVKLLEDAKKDGRLSVHAALGQGSLMFADGRVVDAGPPLGGDPLEAALALFDYESGTFSFRMEEPSHRTLDVNIPTLLGLVDERVEAWKQIREVIPDDGPLMIVPLEQTDRQSGEVTVSADAWQVAVAANGRTPAQIASITGLSEFIACGTLMELLRAGLIGLNTQQQAVPRGRAEAPPKAVAATGPELVESKPAVRSAPRIVSVDEAEADVDVSSEGTDVDPGDLLRELGDSAATAPRRRIARR